MASAHTYANTVELVDPTVVQVTRPAKYYRMRCRDRLFRLVGSVFTEQGLSALQSQDDQCL